MVEQATPPRFVRLDGELLKQGLAQERWWHGVVRKLSMTGEVGDDPDPTTLPYDTALIERIRAGGEPVSLVVEQPGPLEEAIRAHLGVFDALVAADTLGPAPAPRPRRIELAQWLRAVRVHQFVKNGLVFLPLLAAQAYTAESLVASILAFAAFCLVSASVYLLNDLTDLQADRLHPTKKLRPLASGAISLRAGLGAALILAPASILLGAVVSWQLALVLLAYLVGGLVYSALVKRKMIADVVLLAGLYAMRILGGAVAIGVAPSQWLLAFSMFFFLSLAFIKRYAELMKRMDFGLPEPANRNYKFIDAPLVGALAAACGMNAITVFTLYVASPQVQDVYSRPWLLYLICPLLTYWIGRLLIMANRRLVDDDPVVFASRDPNSRWAGLVVIAVVLGAN